MKKMNSLGLLEELQADVRSILSQTAVLQQQDPALLLTPPADGKWSVIQVVDHLNSYSDYYLPAMEKGMTVDKPALAEFKPGWLGDYFTRLMKPREDGVISKKMKALKGHRPPPDLNARPVLEKFIRQQHELLHLLENARHKNIGGIRIPLSITRLIRLKLGDTFRFLIAHEQRHFIQIKNALAAVQTAKGIFPVTHLVM